jgi:hypothetical protein
VFGCGPSKSHVEHEHLTCIDASDDDPPRVLGRAVAVAVAAGRPSVAAAADYGAAADRPSVAAADDRPSVMDRYPGTKVGPIEQRTAVVHSQDNDDGWAVQVEEPKHDDFGRRTPVATAPFAAAAAAGSRKVLDASMADRWHVQSQWFAER